MTKESQRVERIENIERKGWEMSKMQSVSNTFCLSQLVMSLSSLQGVQNALMTNLFRLCTCVYSVCVRRYMCMCMRVQVPFHWHVLSCNPFRTAILSNTLPSPDHCWPGWTAGGTSDYQFLPPPSLFTATADQADRLTPSSWTRVWVALTLTCTHSYVQYNLFSTLPDPCIFLSPFPTGIDLIHFSLCVWA